jgi:hypothetical protein
MADLATKSNNVRCPYESKGVKAMAAPIEFEKGSFKGTLYYTAEFIPSLALKIVEFEKQTTEKDRVASQYDTERSSISSEDIPPEAIFRPKTPPPNAAVHATNNVPSTNNVPATAVDVKPNDVNPNDVKPNEAGEPNGVADKMAETEGVELSHEELLAQRECCLCLLSWFLYQFYSRIGDYRFPYHFWSPFQEGSPGGSVG